MNGESEWQAVRAVVDAQIRARVKRLERELAQALAVLRPGPVAVDVEFCAGDLCGVLE
jgi:hypothetical protein